MSQDVIRYTSCTYHCINSCILKVRVRDGVIRSIEPDDSINPGVAREHDYLPDQFDKGLYQRRPCAKGYSWPQMIYDPNRVLYPMKRVGERGQAKFERISWHVAIDTIAAKLVEVKEKYGPYSIIHHPYTIYGICSFPLARWFGAGIAAWQCHSTAGWDQPYLWVLGKDQEMQFRKGKLHELAQDGLNIMKSKLIVLWGMNPLTTNGGGTTNIFLQAKNAGIPIICIDPRYSPSAEVLADQWIPIRPTTDVAMMVAMANVWFKEDLCDDEFIAKYVEPEGLARWRAYVLGSSDCVDKTPEWAESICGVPAETIAAFARLYARSKPVNLNASLSLGRQFYGENQTRAIMYLQALTGNIGIAGGTAGADTGLWTGRMTRRIPAIDWQRQRGPYKAPVLIEMHKWTKAVNLREQLDRGEITSQEYNNLIGNRADNPAPNIQMVIEEGINHGVTLPDVNGTISALKKVNFVLIWAQYAENVTARYADILLPLPYRAFEGRNEDLYPLWAASTNIPNWFLYRQKSIDMPGEVKSTTWVWTQVAKRLGIAQLYNPRLADVPDERWDEAIEQLNQEAYERWAAHPSAAALNPPTWKQFQEKPVVRWNLPADAYYPFKEEVEAGLNPFSGTESGKIEFYSKHLAKGSEGLSKDDFPSGSGRCYGPGKLPPMAEMTLGGHDTFHSEDAARYPLLMSSPHAYYRVHSWLDNSPLLRDDCYRHAVWMSVPDAIARGIRDDDMVRVFNDRGEVMIPAYVTARLVPGTVIVHHGAWYEPGSAKSALMPEGIDKRGSPNVLTADVDLPETVVGYYPTKALVQVEKRGGAE